MPSLLTILTDPKNFTFYGGGEFKQKSLPYDSIAGGGPSAQPAVTKPIPETEALSSRNPDFLLRGGSNWASALGDDVTRVTKFFGSPQGLNFVIKQNLLPVIVPSTNENGNSKITYDATNAAEIFSQISRNAYSPISTLAQVGVGSINGIHFDRSVIGIKTQTYSSINNVVPPKPVGETYSIQSETKSNLENKTIPTEVQELNSDGGLQKKPNKYTDVEGQTYSSLNKVVSPKSIGQTYPIQSGTVSNLKKTPIPTEVQELDSDGGLQKKSNKYNDVTKFTTGSREQTYKLSYITQLPDPAQGQPTIGPFDDIAQSGVIKGDNAESTNTRVKGLQGKDLIEFSIQVINNQTPSLVDYIFFRAYLDSLGDSFAATWDPYKFVGRGENFYSYTGFTRTLNLNFKIFCGEDKSYVQPTYEKLNYLASTMTPDYSNVGYARANLIKLTVGGYVKNLPGFLTSLNFNIPVEYGWDVTDTKKPRFIDVTGFTFTPIHTELPRKGTSLIK